MGTNAISSYSHIITPPVYDEKTEKTTSTETIRVGNKTATKTIITSEDGYSEITVDDEAKLFNTTKPSSNGNTDTFTATNPIDQQSIQAKAIAAQSIMTNAATKAAMGMDISKFMEAGNFTEGLLSSGADKIYEDGKKRRERSNAESKQILADADAHYRACMSSSSSSSARTTINDKKALKERAEALLKGESTKADPRLIAEADAEGKKADAENAKKAADEKTIEAAALAKEIHRLTKGTGTKTTALKDLLDGKDVPIDGKTYKLTSENILEVMKAWDASFASDMDNEDLIKTLDNECYWDNTTMLITPVKKLVVARANATAQKLGGDAELTTKTAAFDGVTQAELDCSFWAGGTSDTKVETQFTEFVKTLRSKEETLAGKETKETQDVLGELTKKSRESQSRIGDFNSLITDMTVKKMATGQNKSTYDALVEKRDAEQHQAVIIEIQKLQVRINKLGNTNPTLVAKLEAEKTRLMNDNKVTNEEIEEITEESSAATTTEAPTFFTKRTHVRNDF